MHMNFEGHGISLHHVLNSEQATMVELYKSFKHSYKSADFIVCIKRWIKSLHRTSAAISCQHIHQICLFPVAPSAWAEIKQQKMQKHLGYVCMHEHVHKTYKSTLLAKPRTWLRKNIVACKVPLFHPLLCGLGCHKPSSRLHSPHPVHNLCKTEMNISYI